MHCEIGGTQGPLGYVSALGATRLVHWLILVAPSCLRSHNARYIMLKSLIQTLPGYDGLISYWRILTVTYVVSEKGPINSLAPWRHQMETFFALLGICAGNSPVSDEFPAQRPVTRNFDVFFDLHLNKRLSKRSWGWWFETPARSLWRHYSETIKHLWIKLRVELIHPNVYMSSRQLS